MVDLRVAGNCRPGRVMSVGMSPCPADKAY